jgi:glycolate oxidase iron-sulfur subunit
MSQSTATNISTNHAACHDTQTAKLADRMKLTLNYEELTNCMRCGFCQPACPTFNETGLEAASPRGRIALMKAVTDGILQPDESFKQQMDLCLGCRACEPVCPSDVKYGQLIEQTREAIEYEENHSWWVKGIRSVTFRHLFPHQSRMKLLGSALKLYQRSGAQKAARKLGVMKLFPKQLEQMERILPAAEPKGVVEQLGTAIPAKGEAIAKVGMFRGCIMDVLFTETNVNTVKLLSQAGFDVVIPTSQNCCGALHAHSGEREQAKALARKNVAAFKEAGVDYIVSNAGGCGALLIEYDHLLHDDPEWKESAEWFASRVIDISELLLTKGRTPAFVEERSGRALTSERSPRQLMKQVANVSFVELKEADRCCGSAGIYNLVQPEMSGQILDHKMEHVKSTQAQYLLTSNPGCLLQMKLGIEREGIGDKMEAVHIVDFLYERMKDDPVSK